MTYNFSRSQVGAGKSQSRRATQGSAVSGDGGAGMVQVAFRWVDLSRLADGVHVKQKEGGNQGNA